MVTENGGPGALASSVRVATGKGCATAAGGDTAAIDALGNRLHAGLGEPGEGGAGRCPGGARPLQAAPGRLRRGRRQVLPGARVLPAASRPAACLPLGGKYRSVSPAICRIPVSRAPRYWGLFPHLPAPLPSSFRCRTSGALGGGCPGCGRGPGKRWASAPGSAGSSGSRGGTCPMDIHPQHRLRAWLRGTTAMSDTNN